jgi:hypothetical protein
VQLRDQAVDSMKEMARNAREFFRADGPELWRDAASDPSNLKGDESKRSTAATRPAPVPAAAVASQNVSPSTERPSEQERRSASQVWKAMHEEVYGKDRSVSERMEMEYQDTDAVSDVLIAPEAQTTEAEAPLEGRFGGARGRTQ